MNSLRCGDLVVVEFGSAPQQTHIAVVMSPDAYLVTAPDHIVVVPCRSPAAPLPSHVPITSSDEFATHGCLAAQAELVRSVRRDRCSSIIGNVGPTAVQRVGAILRMLICLDP